MKANHADHLYFFVYAVPGKPTVSIASTDGRSMKPFWTITQGSIVQSYTVLWVRHMSTECPYEQQGSHTTSDNSTTFVITGLEENSNYSITVVARNRAGQGIVSDPVTQITKQTGKKHTT